MDNLGGSFVNINSSVSGPTFDIAYLGRGSPDVIRVASFKNDSTLLIFIINKGCNPVPAQVTVQGVDLNMAGVQVSYISGSYTDSNFGTESVFIKEINGTSSVSVVGNSWYTDVQGPGIVLWTVMIK